MAPHPKSVTSVAHLRLCRSSGVARVGVPLHATALLSHSHFYHPRFELWKYKIDSMHATELALLSRDLLLPPHHIHSDWIGWFSWSPWLILLAYDLKFWNMSTKQGALYLSLEDRKICVIRLKTLKPCIILFPRSQLVILLFISISHDTLSYIINFTFLTLFWSYPMK